MSDCSDNSSNFSESTTNAEIKSLCKKCGNSSNDSCQHDQCKDPCNEVRRKPVSMQTVIQNLTDVYGEHSKFKGGIKMTMSRRNHTVTLQWEPFSGKLTTNGVAYVKVVNSISNLPPHKIAHPIFMKYKDVGRNTHILIDPFCTGGNIKFHLNTDGSSTDVSVNDSVHFEGGSVTWIV